MKLILPFLLFSQLIFSQNHLDLLSYDNNKIYTQNFIDSLGYDNASGNLKFRVRLSSYKKILENDPKLKGWIYYYGGMSSFFYNEKKIDSSLYFANEGIKYYENLSIKRAIDEHTLSRCYRNKSKILNIREDFETAVLCAQKSLEIDKKYGFKWIGYSITALAEAYESSSNYRLALKLYLEALDNEVYLAIQKSRVITFAKIGSLYDILQNEELAKKYYLKSITETAKGSYSNNLDSTYGNLAEIYYNENKIDSSRIYFNKAVQGYIYDSISNPNEFLFQRYYAGKIDFIDKKYKDAINNLMPLKDEIKMSKNFKSEDKDLLTKVYEILIISNSHLSNSKEAKILLEESNNFTNLYHQKLLDQKIAKLDVTYQSKQKDTSIALLKEVNINQQLILEQKSLINWILFAFLIALISLGFLIYQKRKQKNILKLVSLEQRLLRSQLNPHFLFNALNTASNLASQKSNQTTSYIASLGRLLRNILENSREDHISLSEELITLRSYLDLQSNFKKRFNFKIQIENIPDEEEILIPPMFIQPFIENAIEHGLRGNKDEYIEVVIKSEYTSNLLLISIENNGYAYSKSITKKTKQYESLSGTILRERLTLYAKSHKSKAYFNIEDLVKGVKGTKVNLVLPLVLDV